MVKSSQQNKRISSNKAHPTVSLVYDSNLLIVFYVQIMPDDFCHAAPPIFERTTVTSSQPCQMLSLDSGYVAHVLRISLADYVQLSLQAGFIQRPAIRHPYHHVKG